MHRSLRTLAAVAASLIGAACADSPTSPALSVVDASADSRGGQSIVEIAIANPDFSTLVAAVVAADLVGTLDGRRQLTVFAPTNAAFAEIGLTAANVGALPKQDLRNILLYHVTAGRRLSPSVIRANRIRMLNGDRTKIETEGAAVSINDANLVAVDITARNGVIHVIDAVLLPPAKDRAGKDKDRDDDDDDDRR